MRKLASANTDLPRRAAAAEHDALTRIWRQIEFGWQWIGCGSPARYHHAPACLPSQIAGICRRNNRRKPHPRAEARRS
jgi:hypothetical protein